MSANFAPLLVVLVVLAVAKGVGDIIARAKMEKRLGRKARDSDLISINTWLEVAKREGPSTSPEPELAQQEEPPTIEPPVASPPAVWVWVLAVFSLLPVLGFPVAIGLAVCSLALLTRPERLAWDRRIGIAGMLIAVASLAILGLWLAMLFSQPPGQLQRPAAPNLATERSSIGAVTQLVVLVISIVLHECAHGVSARWSGDGTAARLGRITLNPLAHVDLVGSLLLPAILLLTPGGVVFGWAKPMPVDRSRFRGRRKGLLAVTLAGVSINFLLAAASAAGLLVIGVALRLAHPEATSTGFSFVFSDATLIGLPGTRAWELAILVMKQGLLVNTVLFALNVLPIPPLDGFGVLESVLPTSLAAVVERLRPLGMVLLLLLVVSGVTSFLLLPAMVFAAILNLVVAMMTGWS